MLKRAHLFEALAYMPYTKNISVGYICKPGACLFTLYCQEVDLITLERSQEAEAYAVPNWPTIYS